MSGARRFRPELDKMKHTVLFLLSLIVLSSLVAASISCVCARPGKDGKIVSVHAINGTMTNVSFYIEDTPEMGSRITFWALKNVEGEHQSLQLPVIGLDVSVYLGSRRLHAMQTDENGAIELDITSPGRYKAFAGEASLVFDVAAKEGDPAKAVLAKNRFLGFLVRTSSVMDKFRAAVLRAV